MLFVFIAVLKIHNSQVFVSGIIHQRSPEASVETGHLSHGTVSQWPLCAQSDHVQTDRRPIHPGPETGV